MKRRFPVTLPRDLRKHYKEIGFTSKTDFQCTFELQQIHHITCHLCNSIARFLKIKISTLEKETTTSCGDSVRIQLEKNENTTISSDRLVLGFNVVFDPASKPPLYNMGVLRLSSGGGL